MSHVDPVIHPPVVILREEVVRIGSGSRIDSFVKIEGGNGVEIGENVHVASFCHLNIGGGWLVIEDGATISSGARILSGTNLPDAESCSACMPATTQVVNRMETRIGKNAAVFAGATIMPGVKVGAGARVGAGALVTRDVPEGEIWVGIPAAKLRNVIP